jgi:hypothetical protein
MVRSEIQAEQEAKHVGRAPHVWVSGFEASLRFESGLKARAHDHVVSGLCAYSGRSVPILLTDHDYSEWRVIKEQIVVPPQMMKLPFIEDASMGSLALTVMAAKEPLSEDVGGYVHV